MKKIALALTAVFPILVACSGAPDDATTTADSDLSSDKCKAPALAAAEDAYGNDPSGTSVKAITTGKKYLVTVGKNNGEDGPEDFYVTFASGCSSKATATPVPFFPNPLRDATHTVYDKLLGDNGNEMPSSASISESSLPSAAKTQFGTWKSPKTGACSAVNAYKVTVSGKETYAVACTVTDDSIKLDIAIWDSSGSDIDEASVYGTKDVGTNGVTWQNDTFEESTN